MCVSYKISLAYKYLANIVETISIFTIKILLLNKERIVKKFSEMSYEPFNIMLFANLMLIYKYDIHIFLAKYDNNFSIKTISTMLNNSIFISIFQIIG